MSNPNKPQLGAAAAITSERLRQVTEEGFGKEHDAMQTPSTLLAAGACYLNHAGLQLDGLGLGRAAAPEHWPWHWSWWKPSADPALNLIKGGALVMAALDRHWDGQLVAERDDAATERYRPSNVETQCWIDRNCLDLSISAARTAIDDARTMHALREDKKVPEIPDRARELLEAARQFALKHPDTAVHYDGADCAGSCLADDIANLLKHGV